MNHLPHAKERGHFCPPECPALADATNPGGQDSRRAAASPNSQRSTGRTRMSALRSALRQKPRPVRGLLFFPLSFACHSHNSYAGRLRSSLAPPRLLRSASLSSLTLGQDRPESQAVSAARRAAAEVVAVAETIVVKKRYADRQLNANWPHQPPRNTRQSHNSPLALTLAHAGRSVRHLYNPHTNPNTTATRSRPCRKVHTRLAQNNSPDSCRDISRRRMSGLAAVGPKS